MLGELEWVTNTSRDYSIVIVQLTLVMHPYELGVWSMVWLCSRMHTRSVVRLRVFCVVVFVLAISGASQLYLVFSRPCAG